MTVAEAMARTWMRVDLGALEDNYKKACDVAGKALLIPVLKADAYGLGAVVAADMLKKLGCKLVAVACVTEALEIKRHTGIDTLVLGMAGDSLVDQAIDSHVILTAYSLDCARLYSERASRLGVNCRVHIKLNTGLNRLGFDERDSLIEALNLPGLDVEGAYTHLGLHDDEGDMRQFDIFDDLCQAAQFPMRHVLDGIGLFKYPTRRYDAVRVGAYLYGVDSNIDPCDDPKPVVSFHARVAQTRMVKKGELIGYDDYHPLERDSLIATLSAGYVDGFPRKGAGGFVEIKGRLAQVLEPACMDQMMVDITGIPGVRPGDAATMLGGGIPLAQYASWHGLNRNEAMSRIGRRVPRVYVERSGEMFARNLLQ